MPLSRSPHSAGTPRNACHRAYSPLMDLRRSSAAEIRPLLPLMPFRGQCSRSAGTFPVSADHADGLDSPVSTLPRISRSSLQQAFRLRQRIPAQRTPHTRNQAGSARFQVFPPTATIDHHAGAFRPGARGCGGLLWAGTRSPLCSQSNRPSWMRQERSRPAARRKLFRCALRIPLPRQAVVPLRQRLCLALGSSLGPMSVPAVCPDSLATKFNKEKHHVQLQKQRPSRRQPRQ